MKAVLLLLVFAPLAAHADFIPGRVRPGLQSAMRTVAATGAYANLPGALVTLDFADGDAQPVSATVNLPAGPLTLPVAAITPSGCGDRIEAAAGNARLELVDYSKATCDVAVPGRWTVRLQTSGAQPSELDLAGDPEALMHTL